MKDHYILQIDTATPVCSVALALNGKTLLLKEEEGQNIHAERLTIYIQELLHEADLRLHNLSAIAISKGPGSYTGLRIGVSTAKGLCYGTGLPLVAIDSLRSLAAGFVRHRGGTLHSSDLLCPMIDARRMEVYQAIFSGKTLDLIQDTQAQIVDAQTYRAILQSTDPYTKILLFGSGADKFDALFATEAEVEVISGFRSSAAYLDGLAHASFVAGKSEDIAYFEPYYLKDFVPTTPKKPLRQF